MNRSSLEPLPVRKENFRELTESLVQNFRGDLQIFFCLLDFSLSLLDCLVASYIVERDDADVRSIQ